MREGILMGLRIHRTFRLLPGLSANLSKRGLGLTAGRRGARISANTRGDVTRTIGAPGTGVSWRDTEHVSARARARSRGARIAGWMLVVTAGFLLGVAWPPLFWIWIAVALAAAYARHRARKGER